MPGAKLLVPYLIVLLATAAMLSGCASLSQQECLTADWESIGYRDGSQGYDAGRIAKHSEACAEHGVKADSQLYEEGRIRGLELFCTDSNGMRLGRQGYAYTGVCPLSLEAAFSHGYEIGRQLHDVESHMQELRGEIERVQAELRREKPPLSERDRDYLLYRLRDLEREYGRSEAELRQIEMRAREDRTRN
jgi:hypothetical protein